MIENVLKNLDIKLDPPTADEKTKDTIFALLNIIEAQAKQISALRQQLQDLRDEINRLKGEQGKPDIKPNTKEKKHIDISSEKERKKKKKPRKKRKKNQHIEINRTEKCKVDKSKLPADAQFKGYQTVVVQGLKIEPDNVLFKKEVYYSPSEKKTYIADLPAGYEGGFDPTIKSLIIILKNVCNVSEPKILDFLINVGIDISAGSISNILIKDNEQFHEEKTEIVNAGLESTEYQQTDDTKARVHGKNHHSHILCNPYYTAYTTKEKKNRLAVLEVLKNGNPLQYCLNQQAFEIVSQLKLGKKYLNQLKKLESDIEYTENEFEQKISQLFPSITDRVKLKIFEAAAIASYRMGKGTAPPVVTTMMCDDAPQFKLIFEQLALCWVHDGRHYKKLCPVVPYNAQKLSEFLSQYWDYYHKLLDYKTMPLPETAELLSVEFDQLFSTKTGYNDLDDRILKTKNKKDNLLLVLKYPEIPLHNNASELAARVMARKRDVSLHTMTTEGTKANDNFLTIVETCKKLGINQFEYIVDRVSKKYQMPSLAKLIRDISNNKSLKIAIQNVTMKY
jgi:hypothetical protein